VRGLDLRVMARCGMLADTVIGAATAVDAVCGTALGGTAGDVALTLVRPATARRIGRSMSQNDQALRPPDESWKDQPVPVADERCGRRA
jgi:hypothetical protein